MADTRLDDYVDVAERIRQFYADYPDGRLVRDGEFDIITVGEGEEAKTFIVYKAEAYRTPDDPKPGQGIAWEPFPGPTPFTRDSELMNAETAAWGRAIVAVGIVAKKIASRQEVEARQGERPTSAPAKPTEKLASAQQRGLVNGKAGEKGLTAERLANLILWASGAATRELDEEHAKKLVDRLLDRLPARLVDPVLEGIEAAADA